MCTRSLGICILSARIDSYGSIQNNHLEEKFWIKIVNMNPRKAFQYCIKDFSGEMAKI